MDCVDPRLVDYKHVGGMSSFLFTCTRPTVEGARREKGRTYRYLPLVEIIYNKKVSQKSG